MDAIYARPDDYDLEHEGDDLDIHFYRRLIERLRPRRVLELAAGSGRVTLPLAHAAPALDFEIVGLDAAATMIEQAQRKRLELDADARRRVTFVHADLLEWQADQPFDLIITPCSSFAHLLTVEQQLSAFVQARENLAAGGHFVVDLAMADLKTYAESLQTPPRATLEIDVDTRDQDTGTRLVRYKTTRYLPHEQRAEIRFIYDKFSDADRFRDGVTVDRSLGGGVERYVSDFDCHVYFPREVALLYRCSGFTVEEVFGDYYGHPLRPTSRQMIFVGRKSWRAD